jgi:signal peptidase II
MCEAQDPDVLSAPQSSGPASGAARALRWSVPVAALVVIVDQLTKRWALSTLDPGPCSQPDACIDLIGGARFHLVFNTGAAFTRGAGYGPVIAVLVFVMIGVLLYLSTRREDLFGIVLFGAVAGGAIGNLLDRVFRADDGFLSGAVIDFIDLRWWPVFNVADSAVVVGIIGIIAHAFLVGHPDDEADGDDTGVDDTGVRDTDGDDTAADDTAPSPVGDRAE